MGWRELNAWIGALNRIREGQQTDPGSWDGAENDPFFVDARAAREERRMNDLRGYG